jgi:hypothetical protein
LSGHDGLRVKGLHQPTCVRAYAIVGLTSSQEGRKAADGV